MGELRLNYITCGEDIVGDVVGETKRFESSKAGVRGRVVV